MSKGKPCRIIVTTGHVRPSRIMRHSRRGVSRSCFINSSIDPERFENLCETFGTLGITRDETLPRGYAWRNIDVVRAERGGVLWPTA